VSYVVVVVDDDADVASAILKRQLPGNLTRPLAGRPARHHYRHRRRADPVDIAPLLGITAHCWGSQRRAGLQAFFASVVFLHSSFQVATA
jgi:hypothetical protein